MENNENKNQETQNESNSAKRLKMLGTDMSEDIHLKSDEAVKGDFWSNLWYQHKWAIILGAIAIVIAIVLCITITSGKDNDMIITYVGPESDVRANAQLIGEKLELICEDYDKNDEISLGLVASTYQTDEQREYYKDNYPEKELLAPSANNDAYTQFQAQLMSGKVVIYLLDPQLYENNAKPACVPFSEVLGYEIEADLKYDEGAIYFTKTDFAKYFSELDSFPQDTLMCVVKTVGTDDEMLENSKDYVKKIIEFKVD